MVKNPLYWSIVAFIFDAGLQVSGYQNPYASWALLLVAIVMLIYGIRDWLRFPPIFRAGWEGIKTLSFGGKIALEKAARIAYEEARASDSIWSYAAERMSGVSDDGKIAPGSPENILNWLATHFAGKIQLFGERPPSSRLEAIDPIKAKQGQFVGGAKVLHLHDSAKTMFVNLKVSKKDFKAMVAAIKERIEKFDERVAE